MNLELIKKIQIVDTTKFGPLFGIIQHVGGTIAGGSVMKVLKNIDNKSDIDVFVTMWEMLEIYKLGADIIDIKNLQVLECETYHREEEKADWTGALIKYCEKFSIMARCIVTLENWTYDFVVIDEKLSPEDIIENFDLSVTMCFMRSDNLAVSVYPEHLNSNEMTVLKYSGNNGKRIAKYNAYGFRLIASEIQQNCMKTLSDMLPPATLTSIEEKMQQKPNQAPKGSIEKE